VKRELYELIKKLKYFLINYISIITHSVKERYLFTLTSQQFSKMETMTRTALTRSDSIFYPSGESIFPFEVKDEARDKDATEKIRKFVNWITSWDESFGQVMQIVVPLWKSTVHCSEEATISIDKSVDLTNLYISISTTGNVYTLPIEPSLTFESVLEYLWNDVDEFKPYRDHDYEYNFKVSYYAGVNEISVDQVLEMPMTDVALSQGTLTISRIRTAWWQ